MRRKIRNCFTGSSNGTLLLAVVFAAIALMHSVTALEHPLGLVLDITGPIGPATSDYITRNLDRAENNSTELIVIRMDTPGGLDTSMRQIIQSILASPVPVVTWVAPAGARAASAGTYILYASHVAAMSPGTSLGAATPVRIGRSPLMPSFDDPSSDRAPASQPDADESDDNPAESVKGTAKPTNDEKMINDAVAFIRSLAQEKHRNVEWAELAVTNAATLSVDEALAKQVIEFKANDIDDLLRQLDGHVVSVLDSDKTLSTTTMTLVPMLPDWRSRLLAIITNPNVAYLLMLVGVYGLILEFYNPGMLLPGVTGLICLLLALYAFQVLPVNYAGLALLLIGLLLIIGEATVPSFGVLGVGGIIAFVIGSVLLLDTDVPGFGISWRLIASVATVSSGLLLLMMIMLMRARRRDVVSGPEEMIGSEGRVLEWDNGTGRVRVHGEIWSARATEPLSPGQLIRVDQIDGLMLSVRVNE